MDISVLNIENKRINYIKNKVEKYVQLLHIKNIQHIVVAFYKKIPGCKNKTRGLYDLEYVTRPYKKPSNKHVIYLNKNILKSRYILLTTLMHEIVHIKQYTSGKMAWVQYKFKSESIFIFWKKKRMGKFNDLDYFSSPWEIEARKITRKMWNERKL